MDSPESFVKSQIAWVVKIVLCGLRHGRKPRSMSSLLHCLCFSFFVTSFLTIICFFQSIFSFLSSTFNKEKHSLFFEKNGNTTSPFLWSKNLCLCSLFVQFKSLHWILIFFDFKKQNKICTLHFFEKIFFAIFVGKNLVLLSWKNILLLLVYAIFLLIFHW